MPEDWKSAIVTAVSERMPVLLTLLGFILILLGISGGIQHDSWLPITGSARDVSGAAGVAFLLFAVFGRKSNADLPKKKDYEIKIDNPRDGERVSVVTVRGTIKKAIPEGYALRILRIYPTTNNFIPMAEATIDTEAGTWVADQCNIGGEKDDKRMIGAWLVGPGGNILLDYFHKATRVHNTAVNELKALTNKKPEYLPLLEKPTPDMVECARVSVWRS